MLSILKKFCIFRKRNSLTKVPINLGIDFGTSYTKVCYRFPGFEESGIVTFNGTEVHQAINSSVVNEDFQNHLFLENDCSKVVKRKHKYLKMNLAHLSNFDHDEQIEISSLSSWYLAKIIVMSRQWIEEKEKDRLIGRKPTWSANIGVPVEHYDSTSLKDFKEVFAVAWQWSLNSFLPIDFDQIIINYKQTLQSIDFEIINCHPIPEIAGAIHSFTTSRESQPGVFVYFDIGAGTVDGVSFHYTQNINCYAGIVEELGVEVLEFNKNQTQRTSLKKSVQNLVAEVVMAVIQKDPKGPLREQVNLPVFVGGGGASRDWYREAIYSTYDDFQHKSVKIPRYELKQIPKPLDLEMHGLNDFDFARFSIAYGLSIPAGTLTNTHLPGSVKPAPRNETPSGVSIPFGIPKYPDKESRDFPE